MSWIIDILLSSKVMSLKGTTNVEGNEYVEYKTQHDVITDVTDIIVTFTETTINSLVDVDVIACYETSK